MYQTDISTSSSQEKHYHPKRLLITLNEHPTQEQAQRSAILPEVSAAGLLLLTESTFDAARRWWFHVTPDGTAGAAELLIQSLSVALQQPQLNIRQHIDCTTASRGASDFGPGW